MRYGQSSRNLPSTLLHVGAHASKKMTCCSRQRGVIELNRRNLVSSDLLLLLLLPAVHILPLLVVVGHSAGSIVSSRSSVGSVDSVGSAGLLGHERVHGRNAPVAPPGCALLSLKHCLFHSFGGGVRKTRMVESLFV